LLGQSAVVTGPDGRFRFDGLKEGKYSLRAERLGFEPQGYRARSLATPYSTAVVTGEHQSTENLVFAMIPGGVIRGTVTDTRGDPVAGLFVQAFRVVGLGSQRHVSGAWSGYTDDRGDYRIFSLPAGSFVVAFAGRYQQGVGMLAPDAMTYPITYFPGTSNAEQAGTIRVEAGREAEGNAILNPIPSATVHGHVLLPGTPTPNGNFQITLMTLGPLGSQVMVGPSLPVFADQFFLNEIPQGHYSLMLKDGEGRPVGRRPLDVDSTDVSINIGETPVARVSIEVEMRGTPRVASSPTVVTLIEKGGPVRGVRTLDAEGRALIPALPAGQYELTVTKGLGLGVLSLDGVTQTGGLLNIPETGQVNLHIVADANVRSAVAGHVLRGDHPEAGILAMLVPAKTWGNPLAYKFDQSDADGSFSWPSVPPGDYLMFAFEDGEPADYADPDAIRSLAPKAQPVTITSDPKQTVSVHITAR
jgi:hypothetical protein